MAAGITSNETSRGKAEQKASGGENQAPVTSVLKTYAAVATSSGTPLRINPDVSGLKNISTEQTQPRSVEGLVWKRKEKRSVASAGSSQQYHQRALSVKEPEGWPLSTNPQYHIKSDGSGSNHSSYPKNISTEQTQPQSVERKSWKWKEKRYVASAGSSKPHHHWAHHIKWDGFDKPSRVGFTCCLCEQDLAVEPSGDKPEYANLPLVAALACGHSYHCKCLEVANLGDLSGEPPCIICASAEHFDTLDSSLYRQFP